MSKRLIVLLAGVSVVAVFAAGCGGGGGSGSEITASSLTKAQFVKKADAVCEKNEKQIQTDFAVYVKEKGNVKNPTEADYLGLVEKVVAPNLEREVDEIRALGAPKGDESQVEAMLVAVEESVEKAEEDPKAVINNSEKIFGNASKLAKEYGLKVCGSR